MIVNGNITEKISDDITSDAMVTIKSGVNSATYFDIWRAIRLPVRDSVEYDVRMAVQDWCWDYAAHK